MKSWHNIEESIAAGLTKGQLLIYSSGRSSGKSVFTQRQIENMINQMRQWTEWKKGKIFLPRKSIGKKWIRGEVYIRERTTEFESMMDSVDAYTVTKKQKEYQYASQKEYFEWKLKHGNT